MDAEKIAPTGIRWPEFPSRCELLYRLSYHGQKLCWGVNLNVHLYELPRRRMSGVIASPSYSTHRKNCTSLCARRLYNWCIELSVLHFILRNQVANFKQRVSRGVCFSRCTSPSNRATQFLAKVRTAREVYARHTMQSTAQLWSNDHRMHTLGD
jgi:hypothetical protein